MTTELRVKIFLQKQAWNLRVPSTWVDAPDVPQETKDGEDEEEYSGSSEEEEEQDIFDSEASPRQAEEVFSIGVLYQFQNSNKV